MDEMQINSTLINQEMNRGDQNEQSETVDLMMEQMKQEYIVEIGDDFDKNDLMVD